MSPQNKARLGYGSIILVLVVCLTCCIEQIFRQKFVIIANMELLRNIQARCEGKNRMDLTQKQASRLEENIVRFIRGIPYEQEIVSTDWLTGLEIFSIEHMGGSYYRLVFTHEKYINGHCVLCRNTEHLSARFVGDTIEDITFMVNDHE